MKAFRCESEVVFPEIIEQPVRWESWGYYHEAHMHKALVDSNTGKLFSIVSRDYRLIRHEEAIEEVEKAIHKKPEVGEYELLTAFYNDGGRMRTIYRFPGISVKVGGDEVNLELHLFNSYDVTWPFILLLGAFRLVCTNGLVVGEKFLQIRKRHVFPLKKINLEEEVSTALKRFFSQADQWKKWAGRQLTQNSYDRVMSAMKFGQHATEEIENRVTQEAAGCDDCGFPVMSLWVFFNILTWYITHRAVSLNHRVQMEVRLRAAIRYFKKS